MAKRIEAYLTGLGYGTVKYVLTPIDANRANLSVDFSSARLDNIPGLKDRFLAPLDGKEQAEISGDRAKAVLQDLLNWSAASGTMVRGTDADLYFIHTDVLATLMQLSQQGRGSESAGETSKSEGGSENVSGAAGGDSSDSSEVEVAVQV